MRGLFHKSRAFRAAVSVSCVFALTACAGGLAETERLAEQEVQETTPVLEVAAQPSNPNYSGGFFAALFGGAPKPSASVRSPDAAADAAVVAAEAVEVLEEEPAAETAEVNVVSAAPAQPQAKAGLFGFLFGSPAQAGIAQNNKITPREQIVRTSLQTPETVTDLSAQSDIPFGTRIAYGNVAKICGVPNKKLGRKIAQYPESNPLYRLYDSDPRSTDPRSFYLTGFADGCARQFTAALAVFGSVGMHELLRYGLPAEVQPYSHTDRAYEKLKRQICGKPRRKPCGAKINLLENDTVFLSIYERFDSNAQWMNLLIHRGTIYAQDHKEGVADG